MQHVRKLVAKEDPRYNDPNIALIPKRWWIAKNWPKGLDPGVVAKTCFEAIAWNVIPLAPRAAGDTVSWRLASVDTPTQDNFRLASGVILIEPEQTASSDAAPAQNRRSRSKSQRGARPPSSISRLHLAVGRGRRRQLALARWKHVWLPSKQASRNSRVISRNWGRRWIPGSANRKPA